VKRIKSPNTINLSGGREGQYAHPRGEGRFSLPETEDRALPGEQMPGREARLSTKALPQGGPWGGIELFLVVLGFELRASGLQSRCSRVGDVVQAVKHLLCKYETLNSNSNPTKKKAGTLPLEPHHTSKSILLWLFWRWGFHKLFVQAGLEP
jgi:hypothetical protein